MNSLQNIHIKLLSFDINSLHPSSSSSSAASSAFFRKGLRVSSVEVAGVVVTRDLKPDKYLRFSLDDGTGILHCILWLNHCSSPYFSRRCPSDVRLIAHLAEVFSSRVQLGRFVTVRGKVSGFRSTVQVTVDDVVVERDPNSEVLHWLSCVKLGRKHYDVLSKQLVKK